MEYITTEAERAYKKRYYQKNRDMINERQKRYREEHREEIRAYQKRYSMTHDRSEYFRQRYLRKKAEKMCHMECRKKRTSSKRLRMSR